MSALVNGPVSEAVDPTNKRTFVKPVQRPTHFFCQVLITCDTSYLLLGGRIASDSLLQLGCRYTVSDRSDTHVDMIWHSSLKVVCRLNFIWFNINKDTEINTQAYFILPPNEENMFYKCTIWLSQKDKWKWCPMVLIMAVAFTIYIICWGRAPCRCRLQAQLAQIHTSCSPSSAT